MRYLLLKNLHAHTLHTPLPLLILLFRSSYSSFAPHTPPLLLILLFHSSYSSCSSFHSFCFLSCQQNKNYRGCQMHHTVIIDLCSCNDFSTNSEQTYKLMVQPIKIHPICVVQPMKLTLFLKGNRLIYWFSMGNISIHWSLVLQIINNYRFMHPYWFFYRLDQFFYWMTINNYRFMQPYWFFSTDTWPLIHMARELN